MKKRYLFLLIFSCFFFSMSSVSANKINNIDMEVYIDSFGNASITEVWDVYLNKGTEGYRAYDLEDQSIISNFVVIDDTGREYDNLSYWDTSDSFQTKAYKSGIKETYDGVELCWGISKYGNRTYTLKYDISNFVTQYKDTQGIYFNLLNLDQKVGDVSIKIYSDILFSLDNSRLWGFGNNGKTVFSNGTIVMDSGGKLKTDEYMVLLVRFEDNIFNIDVTSDKSFDNIYEEAMNDISLIDKMKDNVMDSNILMLISFGVLIIFSIILLFVNFRPTGKKITINIPKYSYGNLYFGINGRKLPDDRDIPYFRDIPCDKDLCYAYWVCYQYEVNLMVNTLREGIIGAILLKWIRDGYVKMIKLEKKVFNFSDNNYVLDLGDKIILDNNVEYELYNMLKSAAKDGKILKANDFGEWCRDNYTSIENWFCNIITHTSVELEKKGLIKNRLRDIDSQYSKKKKVLDKVVNKKIKDEAIKMKGLRKYFIDFSSMSSKEYFDVHLWHEYLMFAQLLGVADKVSEQFSKLYPGFTDIQILNVIGRFVHNGYVNYERRKSYTDRSRYTNIGASGGYSGSSRSSGSGGSSYRGGGRSSRGSSGGGFR